MPTTAQAPTTARMVSVKVTDSRVALKEYHVDVVGKEVIIAQGAQTSILIFDEENWAKYSAQTMAMAQRSLTPLERRKVYRQMIATSASVKLDGQFRLRLPPAYMARAQLHSAHPSVDIIHMVDGDCEWLELWPEATLGEPHNADNLYNRAETMLIEGCKQQAEVGADEPS